MSSAMAQTVDALLHAEPVDEIVEVRVDQIDIDEANRLRPIDENFARALGKVMAREGQRTEIEVCRLPDASRWTLVSGGHRVRGAQFEGIEHLKAKIVSADSLDRRAREISENLWRRDLDPIDRAAFIAELVKLKRLKAGLQSVQSRDASVPISLRRAVNIESDETLETISNVYGFTEEVGADLGFTSRTIRNDLLIFRGLAPSLIARLRAARHPVARNATQLRALAKLDHPTQTKAIDALLGGNADRKLADAIAYAKGASKPVADPAEKRLSAFIGAFARMSLAERKGALAQLAPQLPAGFSITDPNGETLA